MAHTVVEAWQVPKLIGEAGRLETEELQLESKGSLLENSLLLREDQSFVLFRT